MQYYELDSQQETLSDTPFHRWSYQCGALFGPIDDLGCERCKSIGRHSAWLDCEYPATKAAADYRAWRRRCVRTSTARGFHRLARRASVAGAVILHLGATACVNPGRRHRCGQRRPLFSQALLIRTHRRAVSASGRSVVKRARNRRIRSRRPAPQFFVSMP
jgi:hypothetical protein